jgi:hypothetical protein
VAVANVILEREEEEAAAVVTFPANIMIIVNTEIVLDIFVCDKHLNLLLAIIEFRSLFSLVLLPSRG